MEQYFAYYYTGSPFVMFGPAHIGTLAALILLNIALIWRFKKAPEKAKRRAAYVIVAVLWLNEIAWHVWNYKSGIWTVQTMLPLHICSLLVWAGGLMLITKNYFIYEFVYFMGIGGASQVLITPYLDIYGFPHFRFFQSFISHGLIVSMAIYMTLVEGLRPTWKSLLRVVLWMNIYLAIIFVINTLTGSNYLFLAEKPPVATLLDLLPEWPWYILWIEVIGVAISLILYLPFAIKDWRVKIKAA